MMPPSTVYRSFFGNTEFWLFSAFIFILFLLWMKGGGTGFPPHAFILYR